MFLIPVGRCERADLVPTVSDTVGSVSGPGSTTAEASVDGRAARWDEHRRARREELLDGVIAAVRVHGADVGMERIAAAGGTSKAVFYRYFTDKDDLNRCVGRRLAADVVGEIRAAVSAETDDRTMLVAGVNAYLDLLERDPQLYRFVVHHRVDAPGSADYTSVVDDLIVDVFSTRLARLELDTAAARPWGVAVVGAVRAVGDWWLAHPDVPRREVSDYLTALLWNGMAGAHLPGARPS
jgi:AcrR family transcriptional regulator